MIVAKLLRIKFDKVDGFFRFYDGYRHLVLFSPKNYDTIYNSIRYLIGQKSSITYIISHNYAKIKSDWYDSLPLEKKLILDNIIILIKPVFNKNQNKY